MDIKMAPSILSADFSRLGQQVQEVELAGAEFLHIDVMDGHFVPNLTIGPGVVKAIRPASRLLFDVHLMVEKPESLIDPFVQAGADLITVHAESSVHLHRLIHMIKNQGVKAGIALNPATPLEGLEYLLPDLDLILLMTVNPGFPAQEFIPAVVPKIEKLRKKLDRIASPAWLQVDGGINPDTTVAAVRAGARVLVAGSAVFGQPDIAQAIERLRGLAVRALGSVDA